MQEWVDLYHWCLKHGITAAKVKETIKTVLQITEDN